MNDQKEKRNEKQYEVEMVDTVKDINDYVYMHAEWNCPDLDLPPSRAIRSRLGVRIRAFSGTPLSSCTKRSVSYRCWSVRMTRRLLCLSCEDGGEGGSSSDELKVGAGDVMFGEGAAVGI